MAFLNPEFRKGIIPSTNDKPYVINLPRKYIPDFVNNETALYALSETKGNSNAERLLASNGKESNVTSKEALYHKVRSGESIGLLSKKYNVTIAQLKEWNNLNRKGSISKGQKLIVNKAASYNETLLASNKETGKKTTGDQSASKSYIVKNGDTYSSISARFSISVDDLKALNGKSDDNLAIGQKIMLSGLPSNVIAENLTRNDNSSDIKKQQDDNQYFTYKVQPGDTLLDIANKNETSINKIKQWNKLKGEELVPGQEIKIKVKS